MVSRGDDEAATSSGSGNDAHRSQCTVGPVPVPESITCVDCGGLCGRITYEPDEGFEPGAIVAYRCRDCLDRWDIELTADDLEGPEQ